MAATNPLRSLLWPTLAAGIAFAVLTGFGWWQLERLAWKDALIARFNLALAAAPAGLDQVLAAGRAGHDIAFRPVTLRAAPLSEREIHLYAVVRGEAGWRTIIAARTDSGALVLLDRGFVPEAMKNTPRPPLGANTPIVGRVWLPEKQALFTPDNEPSRDMWYWRDIDAMARALGVDPDAPVPVYVLLESPAPGGGWPRPEAMPEAPANRHLGYVVTWFGLAAALAGVYMAFAIKTVRTGR